MQIIRYISPILLSATLFFTGCDKGQNKLGWSDGEIALIEQYSNEIMPLQVIENESDSLFLRKSSLPLTKTEIESPYFTKLISQMLLTVTNPENDGVGIAAPQVGISRKLIAVQRIDKENEPFEFFVNPQIIYKSEEQQNGWEGCLSVPGKRGNVKRHTKIVVKHNNIESFELQQDTIEGFTAIIFQHEIDHLNGILYIDRADTLTIK